jgi:uncharacterized membrane protein YesL
VDETPLKRLLERVADLTVVGLLTLVSSLGVVTALAAATAGVHTLSGRGSAAGPLPIRYLHTFRRVVRPALPLQLILLALLVVGAADLVAGLYWAAAASQPWWVTGPVLGTGTLLVGAALVLPPYLVVLNSVSTASGPRIFRSAVSVASARPLTTLVVAAAGVALTAVGIVLPVLLPLLVGAHLQVARTVIGRTVRRLPAPLC